MRPVKRKRPSVGVGSSIMAHYICCCRTEPQCLHLMAAFLMVAAQVGEGCVSFNVTVDVAEILPASSLISRPARAISHYPKIVHSAARSSGDRHVYALCEQSPADANDQRKFPKILHWISPITMDSFSYA